MRARLLSDYKTLPVVNMPVPEPGDDDVLVRVRACAGGPCASAAVGYHVFREGRFSASSANSMSETVSLMHQRR